MPVDPLEFRAVIGRFPTGVTVITTRAGEAMQGMTANSVTSLSLNPVMMLICVDKDSHTHRLLVDGRAFAINILGDHQEDVSRLFARRAEPENGTLRGQPFRLGETGVPILEDCLAFIECRVATMLDGGDHTIFLGEVVNEDIVNDVKPLVFHRGGYASIADEA